MPLADSIKTIDKDNSHKQPNKQPGGLITGGIDRSQLAAAQTPQLFRRDIITKLHDDFAGNGDFTDDCSLAEAAGFKITMVDGAKQLMKLTDADDFAMLSHLVAADSAAQQYQQQTDDNSMTETRFGTGFDVHKFSDEAGPIWLGGIKLVSDRRMLAHSDGDVGLHALCDAIFGALADGDIGAHFPPSDPQWQNADSTIFLDFATKRVLARGGHIMNLDLTFICETPKIGPHRDAIRHRIAEICGISIDRVSVKATTSEGLGFTGRGEGIAAQASASITLPAPSDQNLPDNTQSDGYQQLTSIIACLSCHAWPDWAFTPCPGYNRIGCRGCQRLYDCRLWCWNISRSNIACYNYWHFCGRCLQPNHRPQGRTRSHH